MHARFFNGNTCRGPGKAVDAAPPYREELLSSNAPMSRRAYVSIGRRNNTTGVPGVTRGYRIRNQGGKAVREWFRAAYWAPEPGERELVSFSEPLYGKTDAFRRAVQVRAKAVGSMRLPNIVV